MVRLLVVCKNTNYFLKAKFIPLPTLLIMYARVREGRAFAFLKSILNHTTLRSQAIGALLLNQQSLQLVTTIYSNCHDDLPNLSRQFNQLVTTICRLRAKDSEAKIGKQRLTDNYKPSFIVDLEVSYQFLFFVLAESF